MIKQKTSAAAYLFNNFFGIAVFSLVPALVLGFGSFIPFRADFLKNELWGKITQEDFMKQLTQSFFIYNFDYHTLLVVIGVILSIAAVSLLLPKINRHMQLGVNTNKGILNLASEIFFKVSAFFAMFLIFLLLSDLLIIGLMYFANILEIGVWRGIVLLVLFCARDLATAYFVALLSSTLPVTIEEGYRLNVALSYSVRLMSSQNRKFVFGFPLVFSLSSLIVVALCVLTDLWYLRAVFCSLYYFAWLSIIVPLFCNKYVMSTQGERKDIVKTIFK